MKLKPMTIRTLPKCNGRPQLWVSYYPYNANTTLTRLRIIYPNGKVEYNHVSREGWHYGCTSDLTQFKAVKNAFTYSGSHHEKTYFLGYL